MTFQKLIFCLSLSILPILAQDEEGFVPLFDGKTLDGWKAARADGDNPGAFSVNEEEQAIQTYLGKEANSKQATDCLNTEKEYSHFILKLEYKWVGKRFAPRAKWDRDSGLLFHVHGDLKKVWPLCLEMQIGESPGDKPHGRRSAGRFHTGDLFVLGKGLRTDTATSDEKSYDPEVEPVTGTSIETKLGAEKPMGEWNEMELHVHGSEKAVFIFNGETVLETSNFTQVIDGETVPLEKGRIGLQAEWAEVMFRNIRIKELPVPVAE